MTGAAPVSDLAGWVRAPFTGAGITHDCYEKGSGPGVVLIPELPGITPEVLGLADHLVAAGFTVVVPSPFGVPGRPQSGGYTLGQVARICVSAEFRAFATDAHRPVGMCFTGGFALAVAVEEAVLAAVASQPSAPFPVGARRAADPGMSAAELDRVAERAAAGEVCALGLRFSEDRASSRQRFAGLKARLGDAFEVVELDSSPGNPDGFSAHAHSVITSEVREGNSAHAARERVVAFLGERLRTR